jgi:hypothetical protein
MEREQIAILAQLLTGIKDSTEKLEEAKGNKDIEGFSAAKKEIISFHKQIDQML